MDRMQGASELIDAPTVTLRPTMTNASAAPAARGPISPILIIGIFAVVALVALLILTLVPATTNQTPAPVAAPVVPAQLSQSDRTDATLKGLSAGLDYRSTWGDDLTRENITQPCATQAALAYPSSPEAADVFARSCVSNSLG